jgi:hypothetical protein
MDRLRMAKIQMNSVAMSLQQSIGILIEITYLISCFFKAMIKVQGCIAASVDVMHAMNGYEKCAAILKPFDNLYSLMKLPELQQTMHEMAREMARVRSIHYPSLIRH